MAIGTYKPAYPGNNPPDSNDQSFTFEVPSGVRVYGGFDATEVSFDQRANLYDRTTLSGDLPVTSSNPTGADAYSVVTIRSGGSNSRVDGFNVIRGLSTYADETARGSGGGVYANGVVFFVLSNLTIKNCKAFRGGGLYVNGGRFHINHTVFESNTADNYNTKNYGGGAYVVGITQDSDMHSVVFRDNLNVSNPFGNGNLDRIGGGLAARLLSARLRVVNGLFHDNESPTGAGAGVQATIAPHGVSFINCTFSQNLVGTDPTGGQGAALSFEASGTHHILENSVVWGNLAAPNKPKTIFIDTGSAISASYSDIDPSNGPNEYTGQGNIPWDPLFEDPTLNDFQLDPASPAVDAGDNGRVPLDYTDLDVDGVSTNEILPWALKKNYLRIAATQPPPAQGIVDMGAHELPGTMGSQ